MKVELEIPDYGFGTGLITKWMPDFRISATVDADGTIGLIANQDGLISLAIHLLTLAQPNVPAGHHIHYDPGNELEEGSRELIIGKM